MEGYHCFNPSSNCNQAGLQLPIAEYSHKEGISVIGGYVYRGKHATLQGKYVFGDWNGKMFYLNDISSKATVNKLMISGEKDNDVGYNINSFGQDERGEIYVLSQKRGGTIFNSGAVYLLGI
jgi:hypothetical protein